MKYRKFMPSILVIVFATVIASILWLTLFSRIGNESRHFYRPFWSYRAIASGSGSVLFQNIGNIVLFIPIGMLTTLFLRLEFKGGLLVGFALSLLIESCQWFFRLGAFEIDDLLHNSAGTLIGTLLVERTAIGRLPRWQVRDRGKNIIVLGCLAIMFICIPIGYQGVKVYKMKRLAALSDKKGAENLLILSPCPVYIGDTDVSVIYNPDGSTLIEGKSKNRAWIRIAQFRLMPGRYCLEGLTGLQESTLGLELAIFDNDQGKYVMVGHEVGPVDRLCFELQETSKMEVLISIYPGWEGSVSARPAIFRED